MTIVYGVTFVGGRDQIKRQLKVLRFDWPYFLEFGLFMLARAVARAYSC